MELYEPLFVPKPVGEDLWLVDGPVVRMSYLWGSFPFPTRMAVVRLWGGGPLFWSPHRPRRGSALADRRSRAGPPSRLAEQVPLRAHSRLEAGIPGSDGVGLAGGTRACRLPAHRRLLRRGPRREARPGVAGRGRPARLPREPTLGGGHLLPPQDAYRHPGGPHRELRAREARRDLRMACPAGGGGGPRRQDPYGPPDDLLGAQAGGAGLPRAHARLGAGEGDHRPRTPLRGGRSQGVAARLPLARSRERLLNGGAGPAFVRGLDLGCLYGGYLRATICPRRRDETATIPSP